MTNHKQSKKATKSGVYNDLFLMFAMVVGCFALYHYMLLPKSALAAPGPTQTLANYAGAARGIVVVDSKLIVEAFTETMQARIAQGASFTEGELTASGADFGAEYMRAIKKYRDAGYLVMDKRQALGVPKGSEITKEVAQRLALDVVEAPDIFTAPEIAQ